MGHMSQKPPSLLLGLGLSVIAMTASLALVVGNDSAASESAASLAAPSKGNKQASAAPLAKMTNESLPEISGEFRFGQTLEHGEPRLSETEGLTFASQWLRNGEPIPNATKSSYQISAADVGYTLSVAVTATKEGFEAITTTSAATDEVSHATDIRTTVKYQVASRGESDTDFEEFRKEVAEILNDPRGWRSDGIAFEEVSSGAPMVIQLATSDQVPTFSSRCTSYWSCRVGANVVINQARWEGATDTWNAQEGTTLAAYRHMVVNHEVGHWLGLGHSNCGGAGQKAPLMMQQSKGLNGCKPNPWPLDSEKNPPRFR